MPGFFAGASEPAVSEAATWKVGAPETANEGKGVVELVRELGYWPFGVGRTKIVVVDVSLTVMVEMMTDGVLFAPGAPDWDSKEFEYRIYW